MADTPSVVAESSPAAETSDFKSFVSMKASKGDKPADAAVASGAESRPAETVKETPDPDPKKDEKKELTPEQRSERDKAHNKLRAEARERELREARDESKRLREENEALKKGKPAESSPAAADASKPKLSTFTAQIGEGKKYESYEDAQEAYQEARDSWSRAKWESEQSERTVKSRAADEVKAFNAKVSAYAAEHEDFGETRDLVTDYIESNLGERNAVSTAIVRCDNPAEVIEHLASHPAVLDKLVKMSPSRALMEIGAISARFDKAEESPKPATPDVPRDAARVRARSEVPSHLEAMSKAPDFSSFKASKRQAREAKTKF